MNILSQHEQVLKGWITWTGLMLLLLFLAGCSPTDAAPGPVTGQPISDRNLQIVTGQTVFVPAYAEVFHGRAGSNFELAVTLAIHNADLDAPIFITSVRYYDTEGTLVRDYIEETIEIAPLATSGYFVPENETPGDWGANFIVEWVAEEPVHEPVIEAIMIGTTGAQGLSLISPGRILSQTSSSTVPVPDPAP